jgi:hypothetical protein
VLEKHTICKKRREPKHMKESLAAFRAHFPDEKGEPVKSSKISDVPKGGAAAPHNLSATSPCFRYTKSMSLSFEITTGVNQLHRLKKVIAPT